MALFNSTSLFARQVLLLKYFLNFFFSEIKQVDVNVVWLVLNFILGIAKGHFLAVLSKIVCFWVCKCKDSLKKMFYEKTSLSSLHQHLIPRCNIYIFTHTSIRYPLRFVTFTTRDIKKKSDVINHKLWQYKLMMKVGCDTFYNVCSYFLREDEKQSNRDRGAWKRRYINTIIFTFPVLQYLSY